MTDPAKRAASWEIPTSATPGDVALALEGLADVTGNPCYRRAARAVWQQSAGRPAIDDRRALAEIEELVATGRATRPHAVRLVARAIAPAGSERATAERLRRKIKKSASK